MAERTVLITGGGGNIATRFARAYSGEFDLILLDLPGTFTDEHRSLGRTVEGNLANLDEIAPVLVGVDTVVHLGGERRPGAPWSSLLPSNIIGTYNLMSAATAAEVRHIVYASSVHAVSGYPAGRQLRETDPVRPADLYGVSKCFGEALGAFVADTTGMSFTALRIGAFQPPERLADPDIGWMLLDFVAVEDLLDLLHRVVGSPQGFQIYNAVSGNRFSRLSIDKARAGLGYAPRYDSFELTDAFRTAGELVGGLDDQSFPSGMREDIDRAKALTEE